MDTITTDYHDQARQLEKDGKAKNLLMDPKSPYYFFTPERQKVWERQLMQTGLKEQADTIRAAEDAKKVVEASTLPSYKDYKDVKPGGDFLDPQGNVRTKPMGPVALARPVAPVKDMTRATPEQRAQFAKDTAAYEEQEAKEKAKHQVTPGVSMRGHH